LSLHAWRYFVMRILWTLHQIWWMIDYILVIFYLDCPCLVQTNMCFSVLPLFWVPILTKMEAQVVVTPRQSQTEALRGVDWLCCLSFTSSTLMYRETSF
jgi:hypothetical protein